MFTISRIKSYFISNPKSEIEAELNPKFKVKELTNELHHNEPVKPLTKITIFVSTKVNNFFCSFMKEMRFLFNGPEVWIMLFYTLGQIIIALDSKLQDSKDVASKVNDTALDKL